MAEVTASDEGLGPTRARAGGRGRITFAATLLHPSAARSEDLRCAVGVQVRRRRARRTADRAVRGTAPADLGVGVAVAGRPAHRRRLRRPARRPVGTMVRHHLVAGVAAIAVFPWIYFQPLWTIPRASVGLHHGGATRSLRMAALAGRAQRSSVRPAQRLPQPSCRQVQGLRRAATADRRHLERDGGASTGVNVVWAVAHHRRRHRCAAVTAMLVVRTCAPRAATSPTATGPPAVFGVLATAFSLLLGFLIFLAFEQYDSSHAAGAEAEALVVAQQVEAAHILPAAVADQLTGGFICYAKLRHQRRMAADGGGLAREPKINPWSAAMFRTLRGGGTSPHPVRRAVYGKWLDLTSGAEEARRDRVHSAAGVVPPRRCGSPCSSCPLSCSSTCSSSPTGVSAPSCKPLSSHGERGGRRHRDVAGPPALERPVPPRGRARTNPTPWSAPSSSSTEQLAPSWQGSSASRATPSAHPPLPRAPPLVTRAPAGRQRRPVWIDVTVHRPALDRRGGDGVEQLPVGQVERRSKAEGRQHATNGLRIAAGTGGGHCPRGPDGGRHRGVSSSGSMRRPTTRTSSRTFYASHRFRDEFRPAFEAWQATDPLVTPGVPRTPFAMPEYRLEATARAEELDAQQRGLDGQGAAQPAARPELRAGGRPPSRSCCSSPGSARKLHGRGARTTLLIVSCLIFVGTLAWIAASPGQRVRLTRRAARGRARVPVPLTRWHENLVTRAGGPTGVGRA